MTEGQEAAAAPQQRRYGLRDLAGGIAAAMVVLPQAMAFGVALFALMDMSPAAGALAGLAGAVCLSLASGFLGSTAALVSSPTGPALALLSGVVVGLSAYGLEGERLFAALVAITTLAGILQVAIAVSGGGGLIKFIPYPVVVGFMTGAALLMIESQLAPVFSPFGYGGAWGWIPAATALATFGLMTATARWLPVLPVSIAGLAGGTLVFHVLAAVLPDAVPVSWVVGALPDLAAARTGFSTGGFTGIPLAPVLIGAAALAMLASLNTLLTSVIADLTTGARHQGRRELIAQGVGQVLAGVAGAMGGSATTGATVVAARTGARRGVGATAGAVFLALILFGGAAGRYLPIAVLAGIIIHVAVGMIERDMFQWLRAGRTRSDALVALLVTIVTVVYDLVTAVGAGVVIAIVLFVRSQAQTSVVHRRSTGAQRHSVRRRPERERELLVRHGGRIALYELRGNLFFAAVDRLFEELLPDLDRPAWVILHLRRVSQVDLTGINILDQIAERLHAHGGRLVFCEVHREIGLGTDVRESLRRVNEKGAGTSSVLTFVSTDEALEHAENALLTELGAPPAAPHETVTLAESDLCRGLSADQIAALQKALRPAQAPAGQPLFSAGDAGDTLFIVTRGMVEVRLRTTRHHYVRLAKCGPGTFLGEVAFLDPGPRTADAVVTEPTAMLVLDRDGLAQLERERADVAVALLVSLGKMQGVHLRQANAEIQRMAQW